MTAKPINLLTFDQAQVKLAPLAQLVQDEIDKWCMANRCYVDRDESSISVGLTKSGHIYIRMGCYIKEVDEK